jgi:hypothetical protein
MVRGTGAVVKIIWGLWFYFISGIWGWRNYLKKYSKT